MIADYIVSEAVVLFSESKLLIQTNPFIGHDCVLKKCCKKYKKGKRCKKCPD